MILTSQFRVLDTAHFLVPDDAVHASAVASHTGMIGTSVPDFRCKACIRQEGPPAGHQVRLVLLKYPLRRLPVIDAVVADDRQTAMLLYTGTEAGIESPGHLIGNLRHRSFVPAARDANGIRQS